MEHVCVCVCVCVTPLQLLFFLVFKLSHLYVFSRRNLRDNESTLSPCQPPWHWLGTHLGSILFISCPPSSLFQFPYEQCPINLSSMTLQSCSYLSKKFSVTSQIKNKPLTLAFKSFPGIVLTHLPVLSLTLLPQP